MRNWFTFLQNDRYQDRRENRDCARAHWRETSDRGPKCLFLDYIVIDHYIMDERNIHQFATSRVLYHIACIRYFEIVHQTNTKEISDESLFVSSVCRFRHVDSISSVLF